MMGDVFRTLGIAMLIAIMVVYIIMVATFRSLLNPLILLVSIPFAAVGAVLLLLVTGTSLGMPSLIGVLMLIGIVVTNAIVLLDLVEQFRRAGHGRLHGGDRGRPQAPAADPHDRDRHDPGAAADGPGPAARAASSRRRWPIVVIGGLFTSTVLTLIIVPVLYVSFEGLRPGSRRRRASKHAGDELASETTWRPTRSRARAEAAGGRGGASLPRPPRRAPIRRPLGAGRAAQRLRPVKPQLHDDRLRRRTASPRDPVPRERRPWSATTSKPAPA